MGAKYVTKQELEELKAEINRIFVKLSDDIDIFYEYVDKRIKGVFEDKHTSVKKVHVIDYIQSRYIKSYEDVIKKLKDAQYIRDNDTSFSYIWIGKQELEEVTVTDPNYDSDDTLPGTGATENVTIKQLVLPQKWNPDNRRFYLFCKLINERFIKAEGGGKWRPFCNDFVDCGNKPYKPTTITSELSKKRKQDKELLADLERFFDTKNKNLFVNPNTCMII